MKIAAFNPTHERLERAFYVSASVFTAALMAFAFSAYALTGYVKFPVPPLVQIHGLLFISWIGIVIAQTVLIQRNMRRMHRRLGWAALGLAAAIVVLGSIITIDSVRLGRVPDPFPVNVFLALNFIDFAVFSGFIVAAMVMRRHSDWHRRLMFGALAAIVGPAIGRLGTIFAVGPATPLVILSVKFTYIAIGAGVDFYQAGRVHPAYYWALALLMAGGLAVPLLAETPMIDGLAQSLVPQGS